MAFFDTPVFGSLLVTLFVIMDPPGIIPLFLALTGSHPPRTQQRLAWHAAAVSLGVITFFAVFGQSIMRYLQITIPALQVSGGLLLLLVALSLLTGKVDEPQQAKDVSVALVPLGTPLLAGPGAIVAVILAVQKAHHTSAQVAVWTAIVAVHTMLWLTMRYSVAIIRVIRESGVVLVTRLSGLLLSAIAVQLGAEGVFGFINAR